MEKNKKQQLSGKISRALDLPAGLISGLSQLHVTGNQEVVIEGHKCILQYDDDVIKVLVKGLEISFFGQNLSLRSLNNENIVIEGRIMNIQFDRVASKEA